MIEVNNHYIMTDEIDILNELKSQMAINGLPRFHKIIRSGDNIQTTCPFHSDGQERKPSFGILTKTKGKSLAGTCHCFACGWSGSFAEMVSNCFGYDDMGNFGNKWLVSNFLSVAIENRPDIDLQYSRTRTKEQKAFVSEAELDKYREYHPYMWKRKMTQEVIDIFDIGYDKKTNCITFPNRDINGNCLFVARRNVQTKFFNYPENVEKPLYGLYECMNFRMDLNLEDIVICESMIDAITCWVYGKKAVALNGLGNDLQFKQLNMMPNRHFILGTDSDSAGMKARQRIKQHLTRKVLTQYVFPEGKKDINELTQDEFYNLKEFLL